MAQPDFQLITTIRYDPLLTTHPMNSLLASPATSNPRVSPFYMLLYHRDRLLQACKNFGWLKAVNTIQGDEGMESFTLKIDEEFNLKTKMIASDLLQPFRVKVILTNDGNITIEKGLTSTTKISNLYPGHLFQIADSKSIEDLSSEKSFTIYLSHTPIYPTAHTRYKTTRRLPYNLARKQAGINDMAGTQEVLLINSLGEIMEGSITSVYFWRNGVWVTPSLECGGQDGTTRRWALENGYPLP